MSKTKNDKAWEKLFDKYSIKNTIEEKGYFKITSTQIKEFREPRLATKFDHRNHLPSLFKKRYNILPITRGSYIISKFEAYEILEEKGKEIFKAKFPTYIQSIDYKKITSEAVALNCAYTAGIIDDFVSDKDIKPTVSGRMSSSGFEFNINLKNSKEKLPIEVKNSQIEIDGGYEGKDYLTLIEAKNTIPEDFLIRQVYYPFRLWESKINKPIKNIFMTYSNDIFSLYEYEFKDKYNYNSLVLVKKKNYIIEQDRDISLDEILRVLETVQVVEEPEVPFPQADSFPRVINLAELVSQESRSKTFIYENYDFDPRQSDYYTNAARYLGLIEKFKIKNKPNYKITKTGDKIFNYPYKERQLKLAELILQHKVFNKVFRESIKYGTILSKQEIVTIMHESNLYNVIREDTYERRASTISGWLNWILELVENN